MRFLPILCGAFIATTVPALAWDIDTMNYQIENTNVIVSEICSGTIIDVKQRLVLTANHCITQNLTEVEKKTIDPVTGDITTKKMMERRPMFIETWKRSTSDYTVISAQRFVAKIVGWDEPSDLAILQVIDEAYMPTMAAPMASDSYTYLRGKTVYAVGNPGIELDNSLTQGIISAPMRAFDVAGNGNRTLYFQHSASIMGGSSGGAIYNDNGELIGVVSAGFKAMDAGLAVPIVETKKLLTKLKLVPGTAPTYVGQR